MDESKTILSAIE